MALIPVIDIFAGPGGLGEGFQQFEIQGRRPFDVRLSIEKDQTAHKTLVLRKFFHQFREPPGKYHDYVAGRIELAELLGSFPKQGKEAGIRAWCAELGKMAPRVVSDRVRRALNGAKHWILLGGPPCQAYSLAGRSRMRSTHADFENDERHFLYQEYLRIVADHRPSAFVFENVKGLLSSKRGGESTFTKILTDLASPAKAIGRRGVPARLGYRLYALGPSDSGTTHIGTTSNAPDFLVRSEQHGIPQARHRIIVVGVRSDILRRPQPLEFQSTVDAARVLDDLPALRSGLSREPDSLDLWRAAVATIAEQEWASGRGSEILRPVIAELGRALNALRRASLTPGSTYQSYLGRPSASASWYRTNSTGLSLHESRTHMRDDLHRYIYAACFLRAHGRSPRLKDFPAELRPRHKNVDEGVSGQMFNDRFRVQDPTAPSTTITSHISKDGHYFIHYAPEQCRSLTVREAARLQTFPDSYFFCGGRTDQYHQVGNAVPPLLAVQIANCLADVLCRRGVR